jgi:hypothetical protein
MTCHLQDQVEKQRFVQWNVSSLLVSVVTRMDKHFLINLQPTEVLPRVTPFPLGKGTAADWGCRLQPGTKPGKSSESLFLHPINADLRALWCHAL